MSHMVECDCLPRWGKGGAILHTVECAISQPPHIEHYEPIRKFDTGADRDVDGHKFDYEAFLCPDVLRRFGEYMHEKRTRKDGTVRDGDNWQKGMPFDSYIKSGWRHLMDWWTWHRKGRPTVKLARDLWDEMIEDALCALLFNVQGYLHEHLKRKREDSYEVH